MFVCIRQRVMCSFVFVCVSVSLYLCVRVSVCLLGAQLRYRDAQAIRSLLIPEGRRVAGVLVIAKRRC